MTIETRINIEKILARKVVKALLAEGHSLRVISWGELLLTSKDLKEILPLVLDLEEVILQTVNGFVFLVFGNDGYDLINDYSLNLEGTLEKALKASDKFEKLFG